MALQSGERLGPYEIKALLGVGGMGEVYRGRDTRLGRDVALKVISPKRIGDPDLRRRFEVEARAASVLNHPSIVTIYDVGETGEVSWIAMEWVEGRTLRQALLEADGPLPLRDALTIARQIAEGLAAAHAKGVIHRDLKPENVMLAADGRSKILDFGLARQSLGESLEGSGSGIETLAGLPNAQTFEGTILGTVGYMSPEQASGKPVDFRSDQFALGLIAYEMLAGQRAFSRPTAVETLSAVIREEPVPLASLRADVPRSLQALIARCLAKRPEDRFASTRDLAAALESLGQGLSAGSFAQTEIEIAPPPVAPRPVERRPLPRRAVLVFGAVLALALAAAWMRYHAARRAIDSLAVFPFVNASKDPDAEYLGDGLTENLISQMSRVPSLRVMARATVFRFKGTADPQEAGRKLGVGAILTGRVSRRGNQLSVSAELMDVSTGARLWGEEYDRPFADLLGVQDSIAMAVSDVLAPRLSGQEKRALSRHGTESPEAYELSLKARHAFLKQTEEGLLEARRLYLQAIEKDPKFAEAHLGVGLTYSAMAVEGHAPPAEMWPRAEAETQKALDLDPGNVLARCMVAIRRFFFEWDWARIEREFQELSKDPRILLGDQFRPIALSLWARGRTEEAIALMERALRVDPGNPDSRNMMADFLAHAGRLDQAIGYYRAAVESEPSDPWPLVGLADLLKRRGDATGAIAALRKAYELSGEEAGAKALASARTEKDYENAEHAVAQSRLGDLEALAKERYVSPLYLARLQAQTGEREKAFTSLEAAFAERSPGLVYLKVDRAWDRIRDDARFASLVRRVGIP
jgi:TolB-like protein/tRNA A-37 threonylcarbamoyl transferase component Bud32